MTAHHRFLIASIVAPAAALLYVAGCRARAGRDNLPAHATAARTPPGRARAISTNPMPATVTLTGNSGDERDYSGSTACRECHSKEFAENQATRHAHTMGSLRSLASSVCLPPVGRVRGLPYVINRANGTYQIRDASLHPVSQRLDLRLGSGKTGVTYITPLKDDYLFEARYSYFPSLKRWYITPGQEDYPQGDLGVDRNGLIGRHCISCHSTFVAAKSLRPERRFYGVGCESCHGPGASHVRAMHGRVARQPTMDSLSKWSPLRINTLCGRCHRTAADLTTPLEKTETQRFQPYAIMASPCYKGSGGRLSCLTCHRPHENVSLDMRKYETVCRSCHGGSSLTTTSTSVKASICKVNPATGCIACHMPQREAFIGTDLPTTMADHLIGVYRSRAFRPATNGGANRQHE
jgi:hypothetical protein